MKSQNRFNLILKQNWASNHKKTVVYNQLLPYSEEILREASETLAEIKANLGCAIMKKEIRPGTVKKISGARCKSFQNMIS